MQTLKLDRYNFKTKLTTEFTDLNITFLTTKYRDILKVVLVVCELYINKAADFLVKKL